MCWEKSRIPLDIWKAGDSIIESVHADVDLEGVPHAVHSSRWGQAFDAMDTIFCSRR